MCHDAQLGPTPGRGGPYSSTLSPRSKLKAEFTPSLQGVDPLR